MADFGRHGFERAASSRAQSKVDISEYPFQPGEKLTYSMSYGWFEVGEVEVYIDQKLWPVEGRSHFYVQCQVKTIGFFSFLAKLEVCMDAWVDAETHTCFSRSVFRNTH